MKRIKKCSILVLCIACMSCAQKLPICKKNEAVTYSSNLSPDLSFTLRYLPQNILTSIPYPKIEKIDYEKQFNDYIYTRLSQLGIDNQNVAINSSTLGNFEIKINNISPYTVCDISSLQFSLQQQINTKYQSFITINKGNDNVINSDTLVVPYTPMALKFVNLDQERKSIGTEAMLVDYLYFNPNNDKIYQKIKGFIDITNIDIDIPYEESSSINIDKQTTINIKNIKLTSPSKGS